MSVDNFGVLTWDIKEQQLSSTVNFLDLTLTIEKDKIVSKTYQKKMNLYLYLPLASAHPQGCIKGTIYGLVGRYYAQNTYRRDYVAIVALLYHRICERGWEAAFVHDLIIKASRHAEEKAAAPTEAPSAQRKKRANDEVYIHLQYHPDDISRQQIRSLYNDHLAIPFKEDLRVKRAIVAYSRPKNIGDYVTQAKLHEAPGVTSTLIMGEYKKGLDP